MKPTLKAPETYLLTLKHGEMLSTFAFNVNLRRYNEDESGDVENGSDDDDDDAADFENETEEGDDIEMRVHRV
jgi:hypothetical protein